MITTNYLKKELERLYERRKEAKLFQEQVSIDGSVLTVRSLIIKSEKEDIKKYDNKNPKCRIQGKVIGIDDIGKPNAYIPQIMTAEPELPRMMTGDYQKKAKPELTKEKDEKIDNLLRFEHPKVELLGNMDAKIWAEEFKKQYPIIDEEIMLGWFANAIMTGYDKKVTKLKAELCNANENLELMRKELAEKENELREMTELQEITRARLEAERLKLLCKGKEEKK